jgi:A/G-specific adenine glycosylase
MPPSLPPEASAAVLAWYDANGRSLAFRATRDPWAILVSEVMAQQTQVSRVVDAWSRFMTRFPTVEALTAATPADVLRAWQGMGYDRRALNLRRAAIAIRDDHGGRVPADLAALMRLPGVGPYTARAVLAIAFGKAFGAVDTNVRRVLIRAVRGLADERAVALTAAWAQSVADASVDPSRPGDWTHALMDVGATVCRPRQPACEACPLRTWCAFHVSAADRGPDAETEEGTGATADARPRRLPFEASTRWLRGRILDQLRATAGPGWVAIADQIGGHDCEAIEAALAALARDGAIELRVPAELGRRPMARLATVDLPVARSDGPI